ncbi:MAG: aminotransferase class V-fold PLP-dependent enzyme [Defluviitaleaceae bacterium]|nr:aminotransferase class V-fold PLP-dependent enzyme [Defluviitaleaceae bacterium]
MIPYYFDNSSTTLVKPPSVAEGVAYAIHNFANAGRAFYDNAMAAGREIYYTRAKIAKLIGIDDPFNVAFTSSFTDGLNLLTASLLEDGASVITTRSEHNSVLRPLYLKKCAVSYLDCDSDGRVRPENFNSTNFRAHAASGTRFMFLNHASNVTGAVSDAQSFRKLCNDAGIALILDVSQTFGHIPVDADCADIFVFTGHKGLFGPQGTGGIIINGSFDLRVARTGGTGDHSFEPLQPMTMPDVFEAGTHNTPGIYGLGKGVDFITETGIDNIRRKESDLTLLFIDELRGIPGIRLYGGVDSTDPGERVPVVSLNIGNISSAELSLYLWEKYEISTRPGVHCAPLLHKHLGTAEQGAVRFSFSYFNTDDEIRYAANALRQASREFGFTKGD